MIDRDALLARPARGDHLAQVHTDPAVLAESVGRYLGEGLRAGAAALVIARPENRERFAAELARAGIDGPAAERTGQLAFLDAATTLDTLMLDDEPDRERFEALVGSRVTATLERWPELRAYGEMVDILWQQGRQGAALALERLWNELLRREPFSLFCAYTLDPLSDASYGGPVEKVCGVHSHLVPAADGGRVDQLVRLAARELLEEPLGNLLQRLAVNRGSRTSMSPGQATILWLMDHMPLTGEKLLARIRELQPQR